MLSMELDDRLSDLERRVTALEGGERSIPAVDGDPFFLLRALKERIDEPGAVAYAGAVTLPDGQTAEWQFGRPTDAVLDVEWATRASALAALGNPIRLTLLQEIVRGRTTAHELGQVEGLGTSGQIYHHLRQLAAEGWLHSPSRGVFAVPLARVVPLLAILVALER